jgi:molybdopterin synthase catalytic subunit
VGDKAYELTEDPIEIMDVYNKVIHANAGAVNAFVGTVREMTKGKRTLYLEYEAYIPMAVKQLEKIGEEINSRWPEARVAITHRIGKLEISDIAVVICVATPHRKVSFEACEFAIERIKEIVPIWKKEHWESGDSWIGNQKETVDYSAEHPFKGERS